MGVFEHGMPSREAFQTYTLLTVGDGLVAAMPALMISVAGGLVTTRVSSADLSGPAPW